MGKIPKVLCLFSRLRSNHLGLGEAEHLGTVRSFHDCVAIIWGLTKPST